MLDPKPQLPPTADLVDALTLVQSGQWTAEDYAAWDASRARSTAIKIKVSRKGGVSLFGINRFPVTFYANQWKRINDVMPRILEFCEEHADELATHDKPVELPK